MIVVVRLHIQTSGQVYDGDWLRDRTKKAVLHKLLLTIFFSPVAINIYLGLFQQLCRTFENDYISVSVLTSGRLGS